MKLSFLDEIDRVIAKRTLLDHPFYKHWSAGTLSLGALAGYAREYFCVVTAVPEVVERISSTADGPHREALVRNGEEERAHIPLWLSFARSLGLSDEAMYAYTPSQKTKEAVQSLFSLADTLVGGAAAMYAFEKEIPIISHTKRNGLKTFYGIDDARAVEYFVVHAEADVRHAAAWRRILAEQTASEEEVLCVVDASLAAQHKVLDACYEMYC